MMTKKKKVLIRLPYGMTLVELLIVIAIIVTVSAAILPTLKDSLKDQKIKQASRMLIGMIESCKAEALASGKTVGISFERLNSDSLEGISTSIQVVRLEEMPPYSGDFQEAGGYLEATAVSGTSDSVFTSALISQREAGSLLSIVAVGDSIVFGDSSVRFPITRIEAVTIPPPGGSVPEPFFRVHFRNNTNVSSYVAMLPDVRLLPVTGLNTNAKVPFKIFRRPVRNELAVLQLPKGICIDLSCSGLDGIEFSAKAISSQPINPPLRDYGPVSIMFSPSGEVHRYTVGAGGLVRSYVTDGDIYLLLGKIDRVSPVNELEPVDLAAGTVNNQASALVGNLMTSESLWIKVSRANGRVSSASVDGVSSTTTGLAQRLAESRTTVRLGFTNGSR